ncbi:LTA synthase family protein, partial [Anaerovorax odorimutans]|uniref:LTA synthase family protein n=1 Tax=Anaerovorax odorimutans TaxID=109327 RepID=UPI000423E1F9
MKRFFEKYLHNSIALCIVLAIVLNFLIETISRHSALKCLEYIIGSPMTFFFNSFIIFVTFSVAFLVKRRIFIYVIVSTIWMGLGITNGVILDTRMTPFTVKDLALADAGLALITNYLSVSEIITIIASFVAVAIILILIYIFAPKHKQKIDFRKSIAGIFALVILMAGATNLAIDRNWVSIYFGNLGYAYRDYGFPYCFVNTWLNTGIDSPKGYSSDTILSIFDPDELSMNQTKENNNDSKDFPNIIMLQLESFFDPTYEKNLTFSQDPVPYFRELKEKYSSGFLTVPSIGAGTANTEFEVLSGMRVRFFGPGEYPYKSILKKSTCETLCYDLKNLGYSAHAIHNHRGAFYGRNIVFPKMGFDTFTSLEYMNNVSKTAKNWAKDDVLTGEIKSALDSTEGKDFIYTISVQGHGQYPTKKMIDNPSVTVSGIKTKGETYAYEYYLEQIHEMDQFIKQLTDMLSNYNEKTVLVMYGDHLPPLTISDNDLKNGNVYQTQYVIWSNFNMKAIDKDLYAYQLGSEVLNRLSIHEGVLTKYHQNHKEDKDYMENLKALQYDMLYGKHYIYGGENPFKPTDLKMGVNDIKIDEVVEIGGKYYIRGQYFTPFSKISMDGEVLDTIFLGPTILGLLEDVDPDDVSKMKVSQVEKNKEILSTTE